jgi:hypothetical protein
MIMELTNEQVAFLEHGLSDDEYRKNLQFMWSLPDYQCVMSANGFILLALQFKAGSRFAVRPISIDHRTELALSDIPESDAPNLSLAAPKRRLASMYINPGLLIKALEGLRDEHSVLIAIADNGDGKLERLEVLGEIGDKPAYALVMGMYRDRYEQSKWTPFVASAQEGE